MGTLSAHLGKGRKSLRFEYDKLWLKVSNLSLLDPDIGLFSGPQFPGAKENFGIFLDSMPDTWGRTLMITAEYWILSLLYLLSNISARYFSSVQHN